MIGKFILTFIEEDDFEYKFLVHTVTYMMFYNYTQVILLRFSYQDLSSIRKFFNARKYLKTDPEAHRIRSAAYRKTNWAILGPLPMWTFLWISMVLTGVYKWRVLNIEPKTLASYPILQAIIMYGYPVQNLIIAGWYQLPAVLINSVLLGFITELKILTDSCDKIIDNAEIAVEKERSKSESTDAEALFWKHFKIELDARVKAHITVLANLINLRQILKPCLLLYYYTLLMVNAFIICSVKNGYFKDFASSAIIMAVYFNVDFFIICYNMSQVDDLVTAHTKSHQNLPQLHPRFFTVLQSRQTHLQPAVAVQVDQEGTICVRISQHPKHHDGDDDACPGWDGIQLWRFLRNVNGKIRRTNGSDVHDGDVCVAFTGIRGNLQLIITVFNMRKKLNIACSLI